MNVDDRHTDPAEIYRILLSDGGWQDWWPGDTPFEIAVGAVLTQNTSWKGVEKAIARLKAADMLSAAAIRDADSKALGEMIRPSGYFNVKTTRLKALAGFLIEAGCPDVTGLDCRDRDRLRRSLLSVRGVGRETADSIMLYALGVPIFVIDAYTRRIFGRIGMLDPAADYDEIRLFFESRLEPDAAVYGDFHAQIVRCAKEYCQSRPICLKCPLAGRCSHGVPNGRA